VSSLNKFISKHARLVSFLVFLVIGFIMVEDTLVMMYVFLVYLFFSGLYFDLVKKTEKLQEEVRELKSREK